MYCERLSEHKRVSNCNCGQKKKHKKKEEDEKKKTQIALPAHRRAHTTRESDVLDVPYEGTYERQQKQQRRAQKKNKRSIICACLYSV